MASQNTFFYKNKVNGFSLVEMLVYIAVLVIVAAGALTLVFSLGGKFQQQRADQLVTKSAQGALEHMLSSIRTADSVGVSSTLISSPGVLTLNAAATTTAYSLSSGTVVYSINSVAKGPITDNKVSVSELRFFLHDNTTTQLVRIELTLTAQVGAARVTKTFYAGATLRGSYD